MKFALIGRSMISPFGFAMRPRMPASWRSCANDPRAPESAIIAIGLSWSRLSTIAFATSSVASVQIDVICSWRSDSVMRPWSYASKTRETRSS